jgi:hypothetical protein
MAGYVALCEGFLWISLRVDLFQLIFCIRPNVEDDGSLRTRGIVSFVLRSTKEYPFIPPLDFAKG